MVHAMYAGAGGENLSVLADTDMLRTRGHDVETYFPRNADLGAGGQVAAVRRIALPDLRTLRHVVRTWKPDLAHVNNTFPSPGAALYRLLSTAGVPIVQHLRNYRMFCPAGTLFRDGTECTECVRAHLRLPAVRHACYRGSRAGSAVAALATDRAFRHQIHADGFIAVSEAMKRRMVGLGLPRDRIFVKHNVIGMCDELVPPRRSRGVTRSSTSVGRRRRRVFPPCCVRGEGCPSRLCDCWRSAAARTRSLRRWRRAPTAAGARPPTARP